MKIIQEVYDVEYIDKHPGLNCRFEWYLGPGIFEYFNRPPQNGANAVSNLWFNALFRVNVKGLNAQDLTNVLTDALSLSGSYVVLWYDESSKDGLFESDITGVAYVSKEFFDNFPRFNNGQEVENGPQGESVLEILPMAYSGDALRSADFGQQSIVNLFSLLGEVKTQHTDRTQFEPDQDAVVMGIIDDGIAIANDRFRKSVNHTRVSFAWRQDGPAESGPIPYGRSYSESDLNSSLANATVDGFTDEEQLYRELGYHQYSETTTHQPAANRYSHGTHVLDLMAGEDISVFTAENAPPPRPIVVVQLPAKVVADTSGSLLADRAILGIEYILWCAEQLKQNPDDPDLPVVINFSFGNIAGPHDGSSLLERYFDQRIQNRDNFQIVLPAGNSRQSRTYTTFTLAQHQTQTLDWRIQPDDRTLSWLHIYLPRNKDPTDPTFEQSIEVKITPPGNDVSTSRKLTEIKNKGVVFKNDNGDVIGLAVYKFNSAVEPHTEGRGEYCIVTRSTRSPNDLHPTAPSGNWQIELTRKKSSAEDGYPEEAEVHAWIERDDTAFGYPLEGRQSYFDDHQYEEARVNGNGVASIKTEAMYSESVVKREGLINSIATGYSPIVVGGVTRQSAGENETDRPANYSSGGPTQTKNLSSHPNRTGPDVVATSDTSLVHTGIIAAGNKSGSTVAINGTSVSAPQVARSIADNSSFSRTEILTDVSPIAETEGVDVGAGKIDPGNRTHKKPRLVHKGKTT